MKTLAPFFAFSLALVGVTFPTSSLLYAQTVTPTSTSYSFGNIDVCPAGKATPAPCSAIHTVSFNVAAGTSIGAIDIVLKGAPGLDFKSEADDTSTTLCTAKTYTEATTCTVDVTFAPLAPGARNGAVEIVGGNGLVLATSYVSGTGVGSQIAFSPATQVRHNLGGGGTALPQAIAVDGRGNLFFTAYLSDSGNTGVAELTAASGYNSIIMLTTIVSPAAMAVDGAGNLFLVDTAVGQKNQEVRELFAVGTYTRTKVLMTDTDDLADVAIDGAGNLFFIYAHYVQEYMAADGYTTGKTLAGVFNAPEGLALDASGNIFVADLGNDSVSEIPAAGGYTAVKTLNNNITSPQSLAIDAAGNLFVITLPGYLKEIVAAGGYKVVNVLAEYDSGKYDDAYLSSVAVDGTGNVFASLFSDGKILEFQRSQPAALGFEPTNVDSTSSPLPVTAQNIGNATLTVSGLAFSNADDFAHAAGSGTPPDCTSITSLASGAECNLGVDFTPATAGSLNGSLSLTDNTLNATAATQAIALSGNGIKSGGPVAHISATELDYGSVAFPGTATKSLTITNTGGGKLTIRPSFNGLSFKVSGNTCAVGITTGSCVLQVEFVPTFIGSQPTRLTLTTNGPANPSILLTATATGVGAIFSLSEFQPFTSLGFGTIYFPSTANVQDFLVLDVGIPGSVTVKTSIDGPDYKVYKNDCPSSPLTPEGFCNISVEFSPLTVGSHYEHLTIIPSVQPTSTLELTGTALGTVP
jgi:streptogramin lyase